MTQASEWDETLALERVAALQRQHRRDVLVGRTVATVLALFVIAMLAFLLTGCGAVEQHERDKAQEQTLADLEARMAAQDELVEQLVTILAKLRQRLADAYRLMGGR